MNDICTIVLVRLVQHPITYHRRLIYINWKILPSAKTIRTSIEKKQRSNKDTSGTKGQWLK